MIRSYRLYSLFAMILLLAAVSIAACNTAKHVEQGTHLLVKNNIKLHSDKIIYNKGEIKDNLSRLVVQKTNSLTFFHSVPLKLHLYNWRYKKVHALPDSSLPKSVERPVLFDSAQMAHTIQNMRSYLFNQGYFYARITDTYRLTDKKAYVDYNINAGGNYLINKINYDIDDSNIARIVKQDAAHTIFIKNKDFTYNMAVDELSRLTTLIRNNGYYRFSQDNIRFELDTVDKTLFRDVENPFENAINFISSARSNRKPTTDIAVIINAREDSAQIQYKLGSVHVYPDYDSSYQQDGTMPRENIDSIQFVYHDEYVHPKVLAEHIYMHPGEVFSQANYDKTIIKLNELGIFQYIRIQFRENRVNHDLLDCSIYLNRAPKHDFSTNLEVSSGTNYQLGNSAGLTFRDKNFMKGANLLMLSLNGGVELSYSDNKGKQLFDHFGLLTQYYGVNGSIDLPKFIAPIPASAFDISNVPHTIINGGSNVINRVAYFTLINTSANFQYSWHKNSSITWDFSPAFINIIRLPRETDSFKTALANNAFLKDSYKQTFIEGENISFTYSDIEKRSGKNYNYVKLSLEEAGGLLGIINQLGYALNDLYEVKYAQYVKFDFDARHYITLPHSVFAFRFYGGFGLPYGQSSTLPYIKQYYVGGPYSLRGWRIRSLGPGSHFDSSSLTNTNTIDLTGDIKLEANAEYRFPIIPLFAGTVKMNGALFTDAGNIWLAKSDSAYAGGEFALNKLGADVAMDVGAGTRFEIASFLNLRLDVAMPVKKPYMQTASNPGGWVIDKIDPWNSSWRANNIIVNISIGYPF